MGKPTGFLETPRKLPARRPVEHRLHDWAEIALEQPEVVTRAQGGRCMDCGVPFCHQGCPLGNLIPDWNDLVYRGRWREAYESLAATNCFPELTGRLCPAPCEAACTLSINDAPVTIEQLEKEIVERAFAEGWVTPQPPRVRTGMRVAVVGSGPAGLAAAMQLNRAGHRVVVYERSDRIGGLLRYGIPDFKLDKRVIDRRLALMEAEEVVFEPGVCVGVDLGWNDLRAEHDAVVIAIGAQRPRDLEVPGRELEGVCFAMDYLEQQNRVNAGDSVPGRIDAAGRRVIVIGGGDTGSDCVGTAHRQGAKSVLQLEVLPEPPASRAAGNPWPEWPLILRTSSSHEEGGRREFGVLTKELVGADGKLQRLDAVRVALGSDEHGRMRFEEIGDGALSWEVDLLVLAMGFVAARAGRAAEQLGLALTPRGTLATDGRYRTTAPGVYAAGDAARGASLIVWAIAEGREAARVVDADLLGIAPRLPTRGIDQPFSSS